MSNVKTEQIEGVLIVRINEPVLIDPLDVMQLRDALWAILAESDQPTVIDFSRVERMSSEVLGVLVVLWREFFSQGRAARVSGFRPDLAEALRVTHINRFVTESADLHSAIDDLSPLGILPS